MERSQSPDQSPEPATNLAAAQMLPALLYPLEKDLLYPRLITFTFSADRQERKSDLEKLSQALHYSRQKSELLLNEVELSELIEILSKHEQGNPPRKDLENLVDSIGVTHSRYFRLTPEGCEFRIRSQMDLDQEEAPIPTHLSIQLNRDSLQRDPIPTILLNWPEHRDLASEDSLCNWRLADPILFALTGNPLPAQIQGEDGEDHTYLVTVSPQVSVGVAYLPDRVPAPSQQGVKVAFLPLKTIGPSTPVVMLEDAEESERAPVLSKSICAVSSMEVIGPNNRELTLALSTIGIKLPKELIQYLVETVVDGNIIDIDTISEFKSLEDTVRLSQVSYVRYMRDSTLEEDLSEEEETEEDDDDEELSEEDEVIEETMENSIDIALELTGGHERVTVSLSLTDKFNKNKPSIVARLEFFSPWNCYTEEQISERWEIVERFVLACNGPTIPEELETLTPLKRGEEFVTSYQLDPAGRFLITPE